MTPKQLFERLKTTLEAMVWGATSNLVFGNNVYIVPELPIEQNARFISPSAFLTDTGAVADPEHPGLLTQNLTITVFIENVQNAFGDGVMVGANRITDQSEGAGILDVEDELLSKIIEVISLTAKIMLVEKSLPKVSIVKSNRPSIFRSLAMSALVGVY